VHRGNHPVQADEVAAHVRAAGAEIVMRVADAGHAEGARDGAEALATVAGTRSVRLFVHSIANASLGTLATGPEQVVPRQVQKTFESMAHSFLYWAQELAGRDLLAPGARLLGLTNPLHESLLRNCGLVAASKAALEIYVRHLAFELGPRGFRVNLLKFPTVITPAVRRVYRPEVMDRLERAHAGMIPAGRMCSLEEVAALVSFLATEEAAWFNGATIDFTGGMTQSLLDFVLNGPRE
jgi:NAD(P)-dependent dehydrogenase (short-subunit alcohol dehydrogenase family)